MKKKFGIYWTKRTIVLHFSQDSQIKLVFSQKKKNKIYK